MRFLVVLVLAAACLVVPTAVAADSATPIPRPPDSDAPAGAPPHWLPPDMWVHMHWTPFDESRLYSLLRLDRAALWTWLRDDNQTIAQLAAKHGWPDPRKLAAALVAPRARGLRAARHHAVTLAQLRSRTVRILRQGHLSQHVIFHSLHQEAGPDAAAPLFGVASTAHFQHMRRLDLGPLHIGRTHGRTRASMQNGMRVALRAAAREGIAGGDVSPHQAKVLLQRQLRQVPRWLAEEHYNGPPQTSGGKPIFPFRASFAAPALAAGGERVLFDAQVPAPPLAVRFGEVNLGGRDLGDGAQLDPRDGSLAAQEDRPCSSFDPSLSADGRVVAYEVSAGNRTFAKRYGNVVIAVGDLAAKNVRTVAGGAHGRTVETAYAPSLSNDGRMLAYASVSADPMSASGHSPTRVRVRDLLSGRTLTVPRAGAYEPAISGDGRHVAFTAFTGAGSHARLQVYVFDVASRRVTAVSHAGGEAWAPSPSHDGSRIAYAASRRPGGHTAVYVRDLPARRTSRASAAAITFADAPSLSADGRRVAFTAQNAGDRPDHLGRPRQRVLVHRLETHTTSVASRGADGVLGGWSGQPQISADGTRVAFTTDAAMFEKGPGGLHVMVRDLIARTTMTASPEKPMSGFDSGAGTLQATAGRVCDLRPPAW